MFGLLQTVAPAAEPITTAEAKAWLRVDIDAEDALIASLVKTARVLLEQQYGRQLVTATWQQSMDTFPGGGGWANVMAAQPFPDGYAIRLLRNPVQSVSAVEYYDQANTLQTLSPVIYDVDAATDPARITLAMNRIWPITRLRTGSVRVTFVAGYGNAAAVPEDVKTAIKLMVAHLYENRGDAAGEIKIPLAVETLMIGNSSGDYR